MQAEVWPRTLELQARDVCEYLGHVSVGFRSDETRVLVIVCRAKHSPPFPKAGAPPGQDFSFAKKMWDP